MVFENMEQFRLAKEQLIKTEGDVNKALDSLKNTEEFKGISESHLASSLYDINEGLKDSILNYLSKSFGGDVSKIKTILDQMKDQELKFNAEEHEIFTEFYRVLQDEKAIRKDKNNPDYDSLMDDVSMSKKALNNQFRELTATHNDIFSSLEQKAKDIIGDNQRKVKYFNAERANDVLLTKKDRYEKVKSLTSMSSKRSEDLENFFGVSSQKLQNQVNQAQQQAQQTQQQAQAQTSTGASSNINANISPAPGSGTSTNP
jgi:hypothetical protein